MTTELTDFNKFIRGKVKHRFYIKPFNKLNKNVLVCIMKSKEDLNFVSENALAGYGYFHRLPKTSGVLVFPPCEEICNELIIHELIHASIHFVKRFGDQIDIKFAGKLPKSVEKEEKICYTAQFLNFELIKQLIKLKCISYGN